MSRLSTRPCSKFRTDTHRPAGAWRCARPHTFLIASHWPEQAQRDLFRSEGHFAAPHRVPPNGVLTPVDGGFRLSGLWDFCSGIPYATHLVCGARLPAADGPPEIFCVVVPRDKLRILDDWGGDQTLGMRASGSNSVEVEHAFVPAHHAVPMQGLFTRPKTCATARRARACTAIRCIWARRWSLSHVADHAGDRRRQGRARRISRHHPQQKHHVSADHPRAEHEDYQRALGQAIILTDAAENLLIRGAEVYMEMCQRWAAAGTPITVEENLRLWAMMQQAGRMACDAVELLFKTAGTSVTRKGSRMERYFRDAQMYRVHPSALYENFWAPVGRASLGLPIRHFNF